MGTYRVEALVLLKKRHPSRDCPAFPYVITFLFSSALMKTEVAPPIPALPVILLCQNASLAGRSFLAQDFIL